MNFKIVACFIFLVFAFSHRSHSAECSAYETIHPLYLLNGAHLSTGKCTNCATCHINSIFVGTPNTCIACHNGDPSRVTVFRSAAHLPTGNLDCKGCHNTTLFNSFTGITQSMIHTTAAALTCSGCHSGAYTAYNARGKSSDHPKTVKVNGVVIVVTSVDCSYCHSSSKSSFDD